MMVSVIVAVDNLMIISVGSVLMKFIIFVMFAFVFMTAIFVFMLA